MSYPRTQGLLTLEIPIWKNST